MNDWNGSTSEKIKFFILTAIVVIIATFVFIKEVNASEYNEGAKKCLTQLGYKWDAPVDERINNFDWNNASVCTDKVKQKLIDKEYAELRTLLRNKPWYKGPNYKWERNAEYNCAKIWSSEVNATITLCHKDYYVQNN